MPAYVRPIWNRDNPPLRLRADAVNHWLKLRHNFAPPKSNGQLRMEIGLDVDIKNAKARPLPWLAFLYTVPVAVCSGHGSGRGEGEGGGARMTRVLPASPLSIHSNTALPDQGGLAEPGGVGGQPVLGHLQPLVPGRLGPRRRQARRLLGR